MKRLAAIDIGSNAIRLMVGLVDELNRVTVLKKVREPVRLGQDVFRHKRISPHCIRRLQQALGKMKAISESFGVERISVVATSALRESSNQADVIQQVFAQTDLKIEAIDFKKEAEFISGAVTRALHFGREPALIFDIGGGSIEFIRLAAGKVRKVTSFPAGTVRILNSVEGRDDYAGIAGQVDCLERNFKTWLGGSPRKDLIVIGTGGNLECIGDLRRQILGKKSSKQVKSDELDILIGVVLGMSYSDRRRLLGLRPDRADVLVPALFVTKMVFEVTQVKKINLPGVGLRDGLLLSLNH